MRVPETRDSLCVLPLISQMAKIDYCQKMRSTCCVFLGEIGFLSKRHIFFCFRFLDWYVSSMMGVERQLMRHSSSGMLFVGELVNRNSLVNKMVRESTLSWKVNILPLVRALLVLNTPSLPRSVESVFFFVHNFV